jgi:hypothetical protein
MARVDLRVLLLGGGLLLLGCNTAARPTAAQLSQGFNLLRSDPAWGLDAAFVKAGRVVYLETRLGALTPEAFRLDDPTTPLHEVDVRYVDEFGNTFFAQRGGDTFIDPTWPAEIAKVAEAHPVSAEHRAESFQLAKEFAGAMHAALPQSMIEHVTPAVRLGLANPNEDAHLQARAAKLRATQVPDVTYTNWYWHEGDMGRKCVALCFGHHGAVTGWNYNYQTSSWDWSMVTCNHGTCSNNMSFSCYSNSGWTTNTLASYWTGETAQCISNVGGGCITGACYSNYNWNPGSGQHNSNDDAAYELWQINYAQRGSRTQDNYDGAGAVYRCSGYDPNDFDTPTCYASH